MLALGTDAQSQRGNQIRIAGVSEDEHIDTEIQDHAAQELAARKEQEWQEANPHKWLVEAWARYQNAEMQGLEAAEKEEEFANAAEQLEEALVAAAIDWLEDRWGDQQPCPYCGNKEWTVGRPFTAALISGAAFTPHFPVTCNQCGNTALINAVLSGLIPEGPVNDG